MHVADRLLAPALRDGAAHGAPHRFGHRVGIAPARFWHGLECLLDGVAGDLVHRCAAGVGLGNADQLDFWVGDQLAPLAQRKGHGDDAGKTQAAARRHGFGLGADQERAVLIEPARGHLVDDLGAVLREADQVAVAADQHMRDASAAAELGVLGKMQRFAMGRDQDFWPHPGDHVEEFGAARMARDVDEMGAVGDDFDALADQAVDHPGHGLLVAGNGAGGKDHAVALGQRDLGMLILGDARQRRARLALAAGAQRQHLVGRQIAVAVHAAEILHTVEIAGLARHLGDALHGAADQNHFATYGARRLGNGADAADMGGKGGDGNSCRRGANEFGQRARHIGFPGRAAVADRVGGIADERQHALVAERGQTRLVGRRTEQRRRIDLPVAGMQHDAGRRADRQRIGFRN